MKSSIELQICPDGSIRVSSGNAYVLVDGMIEPDAALRFARQIIELHEAREALAEKRKGEAK